jgi:hypothetical protein
MMEIMKECNNLTAFRLNSHLGFRGLPVSYSPFSLRDLPDLLSKAKAPHGNLSTDNLGHE